MLCPHADNCPLYKVFVNQSILEIWKVRYCECERHQQCVRFLKSCEGANVPLNLLPDGSTLALPGLE